MLSVEAGSGAYVRQELLQSVLEASEILLCSVQRNIFLMKIIVLNTMFAANLFSRVYV